MYKNVGGTLKKYRKQNHGKQREIAEIAGVTLNHISRVETDKSVPSAKILLEYVKTYNIPLEEII